MADRVERSGRSRGKARGGEQEEEKWGGGREWARVDINRGWLAVDGSRGVATGLRSCSPRSCYIFRTCGRRGSLRTLLRFFRHLTVRASPRGSPSWPASEALWGRRHG